MLSSGMLTAMVAGLVGEVGQRLTRDGVVVHCLFGLSRDGKQVTVVEGDVPAPQAVGDAVVVPGPMSGHAEHLAQVFAAAGVEAAVEIGEYWTFPADDPQAAVAYVDGAGDPPSSHPRRVEGVFVAAWWPRGGLAHMETRRIARAGGRAYLRPWTGEQAPVDSARVRIAPWLAGVLPA